MAKLKRKRRIKIKGNHMNKPLALKTAIKIAIQNGYKPEKGYLHNPKRYVEALVSSLMHQHHVFLNPKFAKALFGNAIIFDQCEWLVRLQQMVLSKSRLRYIQDYLEFRLKGE